MSVSICATDVTKFCHGVLRTPAMLGTLMTMTRVPAVMRLTAVPAPVGTTTTIFHVYPGMAALPLGMREPP